jgi:hypothetical protein
MGVQQKPEKKKAISTAKHHEDVLREWRYSFTHS